MADDPINGPDEDARTATGANVQAHFLKPVKAPCSLGGADTKYQTRRWSLFFFFRIMSEAEMQETKTRLKNFLERADEQEPRETGGNGHWLESKVPSALLTLKLDLAYPGMINAGVARQARANWEKADSARRANAGEPAGEQVEGEAGPDAPAAAGDAGKPDVPLNFPAHAFVDWLKVLIKAEGAGLWGQIRTSSPAEAQAGVEGAAGEAQSDVAMVQRLLGSVLAGDLAATLRLGREPGELIAFFRKYYVPLLEAIRTNLRLPLDPSSPHGPLRRLTFYEFLRQAAPAFEDEATQLPAIRSEAAEAERGKGREAFDRTPVSFAFTFAGLSALQVDKVTLASFPDSFRQGMAARARRLGDIGPSAPENWEGELGLSSIHGFFTTGSNLVMEGEPEINESFWKQLRADIRAFNDPSRDQGSETRAWIGMLFRVVGLEIVHIELGQDPYDLEEKDRNAGKDGADAEEYGGGDAKDPPIKPIKLRKEHFGFRDGLSQPFVDLGLGDTLPGGGTASRRGTWAPVAPGEIFLDQLDESGERHLFPLNEELRKGSTYLVFRKLEQDVTGFRAFMGQQRPDKEWDQRKLAAQMVGRWPNGTPLARSPQMSRNVEGDAEATLNDFRYAEDDPNGRKCPLGAHIRRANPRDIGGRNDVRHHRILRRGIAYGGPLLHHKQPDDSEKRGLLFIAANARIDLQFEVIQGDWINGGEFLGQAGLGRCPLTGANDGSLRATFFEPGAAAPVRGIPSFVTLRGGDYFFAPGLTALQGFAKRKTFGVSEEALPFHGFSMGDAATPGLLNENRLGDYGRRILKGADQVIRVKPPSSAGPLQPDNIAFVGTYDDVKLVLSNTPNAGGGVDFSVAPYRIASRRITRGEDLLIATDAGPAQARREHLLNILLYGWNMLEELRKEGRDPADKDLPDEVRRVAAARLDMALRRTAGARRIDLVDDVAVPAAYGVLEDIFGVRGPPWLSEMAPALQFGRQHLGDLPPDWIARLRGGEISNPGLSTMRVWTSVLVADLIANVQSVRPLQALAKQAGAEMLSYLDIKLVETQAEARTAPHTLVKAFLRLLADEPIIAQYYVNKGVTDRETMTSLYLKDVAVLLLEIIGSTLAVIPLTFASVMTYLLRARITLPAVLPRLDRCGIQQIIYEAERLNPNAQGIRSRRCEVDTTLPGRNGQPGQSIAKGDIVAALIGAANKDESVFPEPERFSLGTWDPLNEGFERKREDYLLFGVNGSDKYCRGRDLVAMPVLEECIRACGRLQGLRRVAGPGGEPQKLAGVTVGLPARFTRLLPR